jgi:hypothetical protein
MTAMRAWLDENGCEPAKFTCERYGEITIIALDFANEAQAEAFARRFEAPTSMAGSSILLDQPEPSPDPNTWGPRIGERETMLQVCRWRIMAEEIRTEADGLSTQSAKETMQTVAETWDLMAKNLERRLMQQRR